MGETPAEQLQDKQESDWSRRHSWEPRWDGCPHAKGTQEVWGWGVVNTVGGGDPTSPGGMEAACVCVQGHPLLTRSQPPPPSQSIVHAAS